MDLKRVAKRLLPPILVDVAKRLRDGDRRTGPPEWEYLPDGWRSKDPRIKGWNVESVLETQKAKWAIFRRLASGRGSLGIAHEAPFLSDNDYLSHNTLMCFAYVLALAARKTDRISLLDWGGGIGHYYLISRALLPDVEIDYHCKEVPLLCAGGRELLPEVSFYDDEEDCFQRTYDLVFASGSLQYSEDWRSVIKRLAEASRTYLYITRLPVVNRAPSFVVVQRPYPYGYGTEYLGWFLNRGELLDYMEDLRFELVREFLIQEQPFVEGAPEQGEYRGFLFRPKREYRAT